jgi:Tol biopolymer transport system component
VIDLNSGEMTPLPKAIIRSVAKSHRRAWRLRYAASPDGSRLAYEGIGDDGSHQIFTAGIDGTEIRQMTHDPTRANSPAWSSDGTMIAYEGSGSEGGRSLFVLDLASGESTRIADVRRWALPQFTPDGSSILYGSGRGLAIVSVAGGESRPLFSLEERGLQAAHLGSMSPDGSLVTFWGAEGASCCSRFVANVDGTDRRPLLAAGLSSPAGTWSPDGSRIVSAWWGNSIEVVDIATGRASPAAEGKGAIWLDRHTLLVEVL